jgi:hypothetical protein
MLGDMLSVRAAAEKPPLSTTFTKVAGHAVHTIT